MAHGGNGLGAGGAHDLVGGKTLAPGEAVTRGNEVGIVGPHAKGADELDPPPRFQRVAVDGGAHRSVDDLAPRRDVDQREKSRKWCWFWSVIRCRAAIAAPAGTASVMPMIGVWRKMSRRLSFRSTPGPRIVPPTVTAGQAPAASDAA